MKKFGIDQPAIFFTSLLFVVAIVTIFAGLTGFLLAGLTVGQAAASSSFVGGAGGGLMILVPTIITAFSELYRNTNKNE